MSAAFLHRLQLALCAAALAAIGEAQDTPRGHAAKQLPPALSTADVAGVMANNGALLGVARRWRATFGADDVEFLPALGKNAPQAAPFRLRFVDAHRDGAIVAAATTTAPGRDHDRRSVTYHRGALDERFVARPDGLKQSFVFREPPRGRGDLVVRVAVTTPLQAVAGERLAWRNGRGGGVDLGDVVGIDAAGTRCAGSARLVDGGFELSLPAAFVERAAYPLELDPLIGAASEALPGADCDFPDVAYDAYTGTYCVVWTQFFSGGTTGIVAGVFYAASLQLAYAFAINQTGDEDSARVGTIGGTGLYVIVWVNRANNQSSISGLAFEPSQAQATNVFTIDGPAGLESPILSSEATVYDDDLLVAWLDDTYGLLGCSLAIDAQLQPSATPIVQIAGGNVTEPAISKQGGNPGVHLITWVDRPPGSPGWVRAQVVDNDMNLIGTGAWIRNVPQNAGWPAVDGDGFKFLVAWEEQEVANPSATDIRGRLVTVGANGITSQGPVIDLVLYPNDTDYAVDVALLGDKFGITYMGAAPGAPYFDDVYFKSLATNGTPIGGELRLELTPGSAYTYEHTPRILGRRDGDPGTAADDGIVVFADQSTVTADSNVGLQAVESMGAGGAIVDLGGGCGPGGLATTPGPFALGNTTFAFELYGAQSLAIPFVFVGVPGPWIQCGVCAIVNPILFFFAPNTAGTAVTTWPVSGDASWLGLQIEFQFVTFNVNYVGCPALPGVATSNIVRATLDY